MTELVSWFQMEYPHLVKAMKASDHHLTYADNQKAEMIVGYGSTPEKINPYHCESDVFTHTMMVCKQAENAPYTVRIAALLHDIGKPDTRAVNPKNGRVSFYNHDAVSAFMSLEILKREELGLSKDQQVHIFNLIALHTQIYKLSVEQLAAIGDLYLVENLIELGKADHGGRFHTAGDAVIPTIEEVKYVSVAGTFTDNREKEVIVLCGLPASGKSRWTHNNAYNRDNGDLSMIISRDHYFAEHFPDLDYNTAWKQANQKLIDRWLVQKFAYAKRQDQVIVDMTHMSKKSRKRSLSHFGPEYKKKCVVFLTDLETLHLRNSERTGKVIDKSVIERMMRSFYPPTLEEFDEIEYVIN
jgi:putative nucleotidyltransferase with HDIG domain